MKIFSPVAAACIAICTGTYVQAAASDKVLSPRAPEFTLAPVADVAATDNSRPQGAQIPEAIGWEEYGSNTEARYRARGYQPMESVILPRGKRQLLVDNYVVEHMDDNLRKILHQPTRHEGNPVLFADRPWETECGWASVVKDHEEGIFKAWYNTGNGLGYATSKDGIHWIKPMLGILEWNGNKENNLVRPKIESPTVIKDPYETNPRRKYKCFAQERNPITGIYVAFSPDGIHWERKDQPVLTSNNDRGLNDRPTLMQDLARRRFIGLTKREIINPFGRGDWGFIHRARAFSLSNDFEKWSDPALTLRTDDQDPPDLQIYGLVGFNYESMYLGMIDVHWSRGSGPMEQTLEVQLACSRDGEVWWRAGNRQTFIPLGPEGSWDRLIVVPQNCPPIKMGEELWIYYCGGARRHRKSIPEQRRREPWNFPGHPENESLMASKKGEAGSGMGMARLRIDGFISVDAGPRPGRLLTRPLYFDGKDLHINADAGHGIIRAEIFEARKVKSDSNWPSTNWEIGEPIPGFTLNDCIPIREDTTNGLIRWRGSDNIERLSGKPIVIRFHLVQSSFYSFWIE